MSRLFWQRQFKGLIMADSDGRQCPATVSPALSPTVIDAVFRPIQTSDSVLRQGRVGDSVSDTVSSTVTDCLRHSRRLSKAAAQLRQRPRRGDCRRLLSAALTTVAGCLCDSKFSGILHANLSANYISSCPIRQLKCPRGGVKNEYN